MRVILKIALFVFMCGLAAIAHANTDIQKKVYPGGYGEPDTILVKDRTHGVICWVYSGRTVSSQCFTKKEVENFDKD